MMRTLHWVSLALVIYSAFGQSDPEVRAAGEAIWEADRYRFPEKDAVIEPYGEKLFTFVNEGRMGGTPIYQLLRNLFPYYAPGLGVADSCAGEESARCKGAQVAFINEMFNRDGRPMQVAHEFLISHNLAPNDVDEFKALLHQYWFQPYNRNGDDSILLDSSGFERTFLGEIGQDGYTAFGFHNWVSAYYEEKGGRFQYGGSVDSCYPLNLRMDFTWRGASRENSSVWIRSSPEAEMALYTMCFLARPNGECEVDLDGVPNAVTVTAMPDVSPLTIGQAYPLCNGSLSTGGPPSQEELNDVTNRIWAADIYRFPDEAVIVNNDGPILFTYVNESLLYQPPFAAFIPLLDNFDPYVGTPETCGEPCRQEEEAFLDAILSQPGSPMRIAQDFLVEHGLASADLEEFKLELRDWWFQLYSRSGGAALDSSGFEHVFLGEIRSGSDVLGLHNWFYVYMEEKEGNFIYGDFQKECEPFQVQFSHTWLGRPKPINSVWARASPDAELAVFTVCFLVKENTVCNIVLDGVPNAVQTYDMSGIEPRTVGTAYALCY